MNGLGAMRKPISRNGPRLAPARNHAIDRFCQDNRVQVCQPQRSLQVKFTQPVAGSNDFVAYVVAMWKVDGTRRLTHRTSAAIRGRNHKSLTLAFCFATKR
jgi:hypothetical protein